MLNRKKEGKRNMGGRGKTLRQKMDADGGRDTEIVTKSEYKETREKKMERNTSP